MTSQYRSLEELSYRLSHPNSSPHFIKAFREEIRQGRIEAAYLPGKFILPGAVNTRTGTQRLRQHRNMIYRHTDQVDAWFTALNDELNPVRKIKISAEAIINGDLDFTELAAQTRALLQRRYELGQALGQQRTKQRSKRSKQPAKPARQR